MKLFTRSEMRRLEDTAEKEGVSLEYMMEQAGKAVSDEAEALLGNSFGKEVVLLCGKGNNGGDGFVCARYLSERGARCTVILTQGQPTTELALAAFVGMPQEVRILSEKDADTACSAIERADCIIDAVFGFSFRGELSGASAEFIRLANAKSCLKISADIPSGAECGSGRVSGGTFRADVTVAFTAKKPAHCSYPAKEYCGEVVVRQVGVPKRMLESAETEIFETSADFAKGLLKEPAPTANKGNLGKLLLVCGSYGMAGACIMAARAALRCGVGLLNIAVSHKLYPILAQAVPEAIFTVLDMENERQESKEKLLSALDSCTACLIGCGLGEDAEKLCPIVFANCESPLIIDADGINFIAKHPEWLEKLKAPAVLTPHPGEMARLCSDSIPEIQADRIDAARTKAKETGAVLVLKGAATVIASPDGRCAVNPTGNAGMAKGGSGDVLAGMISSLAAQGTAPFEAAAVGVYVHGMAGDVCKEKFTSRSMLPTDVIEGLAEVFLRLAPAVSSCSRGRSKPLPYIIR